MSEYKDEIIDHYKNPRNFGVIDGCALAITEANSSCGDVIKVFMEVDGDRVKSVKWQGVGCAISTAAASMLSEKITNMSLSEVREISEDEVMEMLGGEVSAGRKKCATLAHRAILKMLDQI